MHRLVSRQHFCITPSIVYVTPLAELCKHVFVPKLLQYSMCANVLTVAPVT